MPHLLKEYAKSLGLSVGVNCMKSYALKPYEFNKIARSIDSWKLADWNGELNGGNYNIVYIELAASW